MLQRAAADHEAGRLEAAKAGYESVLTAAPQQPDALQLLGVLRHQQGAHEEGVALLERATALQPQNPNIRNNLANVLRDMGRLMDAEREFALAIALAPDAIETYINHGIVLEELQRYEHACAAFAGCLARAPDEPRALRGLAVVQLRLGRFENAEANFRRLNALRPGDPEVLGNLGIASQALGRSAEAERFLRAAVERAGAKPALRQSLLLLLNKEPRDAAAREAFREILRADPEAWKLEIHIAHRLLDIGRVEQTRQLLEDMLAVHADVSQVWNEAGVVYLRHGKFAEAIAHLEKAIALDPQSSAAYTNLGAAYLQMHQLPKSVATFREALKRDPGAFQAQVCMIRALRLMERFEEAQIYARSALDLMESAPSVAKASGETNVLLLQFFKTICDFDAIERLGDVWDIAESLPPTALVGIFLDQLVFAQTPDDVRRFVGLVGKWASYYESLAAQGALEPAASGEPKPKLRIGILSSDLRSHSVARFVMPLLKDYDREKFEIYCYSPLRRDSDPVQIQARGLATSFKYIDGLADREAAALIRADAVDILLDLNGFTEHSRMPIMTYKPAPVQMSWLGYPFTSGLKAIDYVVMDRHVLPTDESTLVEQPLVMPEAWICFGKYSEEPIDPMPPMARNGVVTFGTLNNPYKFSRDIIALWARVMREVPDSRFLLVRPEASSTTLVGNIAREFAKHGISSDRLYVRNNRAEKRSHFAYYNEIDISLDTFPVTGGTTTCDALWMGVPVMALVGPAYHHRISSAILKHMGLDDLCAESHDDFVAKAVALANDPARLAFWRANLRQAMIDSPLCDEPRFAHQFQEMLEQVAQLHGLR
ncbi:MAG: tetratricopeptide repeat protein [Alphaproteobacteria bacterium]